MICLCPGDRCAEAKLYHYDFLSGEGASEVPSRVREHVTRCTFCQAQIDHLRHLLAEPSDPQDCRHSLMTDLLSLHFSHLDQEITCAVAKPFIPTLVDPALPIRVATPITQHIDHCTACQRERETLEDLGLTSQQLYRLGQFLADPAMHEEVPAVTAWADQVAHLQVHDLTAAQLKQVCLSPSGRSRIQTGQKALLDSLPVARSKDQTIACEGVESADLFAHALPYGEDPGRDEDWVLKEHLADHLRGCRRCLQRLQTLQQVLFDMAERKSTEVVTMMRLEDSEHPSQRVPRPGVRSQGGIKSTPGFVFPMLRALAAVLVLVLGLGAIMRVPRATAFTYQQLHSALMLRSGIHITHIDESSGDIQMQIWALPQAGQWLIDEPERLTLWDIEANRFMQLNKDTGAQESNPIREERLPGLKQQLDSLFGLFPYTDLFPSGAQWEQARQDDPSAETILWELKISQPLQDGKEAQLQRVLGYRLRAHDRLPQSLEIQQRTADGLDMERTATLTVAYPEDLDLIQKREELSGRVLAALRDTVAVTVH